MAKGDKKRARDATNTNSTESTTTVRYADLNAASAPVEEIAHDVAGDDISDLGKQQSITSKDYESSPEKAESEVSEEVSSPDVRRKRKIDDRDSEIQDLKELVLQLKATQDAQSNERNENSRNRSSENTNYGFFDSVVTLDKISDVNKATVMAVINQYEKPNFNRPILECIKLRAKNFLDFNLRTHGYATSQEQIDSWSIPAYMSTLMRLYENPQCNTTTLFRFNGLALYKFYTTYELTPAFCELVFEVIENMTDEELANVQFQKLLVMRAFNTLSNKEPIKTYIQNDVLSCKTFGAWFEWWVGYRISMKNSLAVLEAQGFKILPKVYILADQDKNDRPEGDKGGKPSNPKGDKLAKGGKPTANKPLQAIIVLDPKIPACNMCGRQEFDKKQKEVHSTTNCYLKFHEDANKDPTTTWKNSLAGKAFAAMNPPHTVLPFGLRMSGEKREFTKKNRGNNDCMNCNYLVSLNKRFSTETDFLSLNIISVQMQNQPRNLESLAIKLEALIDTGDLGDDYVAQDVIREFDLQSFVIYNANKNKLVCSGLDNTCNESLGAITLTILFVNEVTKNSEILTLPFSILAKSPIDIIIGRKTIKEFDLASKLPSHFYASKTNLLSSLVEDIHCITCLAQDGPVQTCGCQRHIGLQSIVLSATQTEIQSEVALTCSARRSSATTSGDKTMVRRGTLPFVSATCNDNPLADPRAGVAILSDTPPQSLMAATQTHHALYSSYSDVESYKLNDKLMYTSLYAPLYEDNPITSDLDPNFEVFKTLRLQDHTLPTNSILSAVVADEIPNKFIDDDGIDELSNDAFSPWSQNEQTTQELLDMIYIEGTPDLQKGIRALCKEYGHIFALNLPKDASKLTPFNMTVDLTKWRVQKNRMPPRQQSVVKQVEISKQINELLGQGIIVPSTAEYYSQVMVVPKPDGKHRLVIDFQNLNLVTESASHPIPNIKQMLNRLGEHRSEIFGVMDLTQGYHQVNVAKSSMIFTAFIAFCGIYQWCRLPMGLKKAPPHFQEQMAAVVLIGLIYIICEVYLDDIIVHGATAEEFLARLRLVFERMDRYHIILKPNKCKFGLSSVEYCGRVISRYGLSMSEKKIASVINFPMPVFAKEMKSFLGLANYFREFVPNHSTIVHSLQALIPEYRRSNRIVWNAEARLAFDAVRTLINDCPTMYFLVPDGELYLYTDASDFGIGGYLYQLIDEKERPVAFVSKSLTSTQLRWAIIQKEAYAIFVTIKQLDHLLRDRHFKLFTDHKNLLYITESSNPMIYRWWMAIQEMDFTKEFTLGINNPIADSMSRLCPNLMLDEPNLYDDMDILCAITEKVILNHSDYQIISSVHNSLVGHSGLERTVKRLTLKLNQMGTSWKFLRQKVKRFIALCPCCQKMSQLKVPIAATPFTVSTYSPMESLNIDFQGPYPDKGYVLVIIDSFTRWVELYCVKAADAECTAQCLLSHFGRFGSPSIITSDRGSHFIATVIEEFLRLIGTQHMLTLAYSKEENSLVERANKEVNRHMRALTFDSSTIEDYQLCIPIVQRILNSSYNDRTGISPAELLFGNAISLDRGLFLPPAERNASILTKPLSESAAKLLYLQDTLITIAAERLKITDSQRLGYYSTERTEYVAGDLVLVNCRKQYAPTRLHTKLIGPLRVVSNKGNEYTLFNLVTNLERHYHITEMRPFHFDPSITDPLDIARRDYLEFFVDKIIDHRGSDKRKKELEFLVQWTGFDPSYNSWEPYATFRDNERLHEYLREESMHSLIPTKFR
jgi:transposase InsO family protein